MIFKGIRKDRTNDGQSSLFPGLNGLGKSAERICESAAECLPGKNFNEYAITTYSMIQWSEPASDDNVKALAVIIKD